MTVVLLHFLIGFHMLVSFTFLSELVGTKTIDLPKKLLTLSRKKVKQPNKGTGTENVLLLSLVATHPKKTLLSDLPTRMCYCLHLAQLTTNHCFNLMKCNVILFQIHATFGINYSFH